MKQADQVKLNQNRTDKLVFHFLTDRQIQSFDHSNEIEIEFFILPGTTYFDSYPLLTDLAQYFGRIGASKVVQIALTSITPEHENKSLVAICSTNMCQPHLPRKFQQWEMLQ